MAICFFDTSALIKYYHEEPGEEIVADIIDDPENQISISRLSVAEWHSAIARYIRTGIFTTEEFQTLRAGFLSDIRTRKVHILPLERVHQNRAVGLLVKHSPTKSLRTLDALQLAVALDLNNHTPLDHFICADIHFCQIATQEALPVLNPESP